MFKKYLINKNKYQPSKYSIDKYKDSSRFISLIKKEALSRQVVQVDNNKVIFGVEGPVILPSGKFWSVSAYVENGIWGKHYILVSPNLDKLIKNKKTFLRLDSGCVSGMILGDKTCDCLQQLRKAQEIALDKGGIIIHIPKHDGRGWQEYKMANQRIMDECQLDTISAALNFYGNENIIDRRSFTEAAIILRAMGFEVGYKFNLGTKNSKKSEDLEKYGFVVYSKPVEIECTNEEIIKNLKAKYKYWDVCSRGGRYEKVEKRQVLSQ